MAIAPERARTTTTRGWPFVGPTIYEGTRIPANIPSILEAPRRGANDEDILQVKTGPLGLGKHYYIPFSAIQDMTSDCVFVDQPKDRIDDMGWDVKPDYLDTLS